MWQMMMMMKTVMNSLPPKELVILMLAFVNHLNLGYWLMLDPKKLVIYKLVKMRLFRPYQSYQLILIEIKNAHTVKCHFTMKKVLIPT